VLTEGQVNEGIRVDWERAKARRAVRGGVGDPGDFKGVEWRFAERYERKWDALPETTSGWLFILSRPFQPVWLSVSGPPPQRLGAKGD